MEVSLPGLTRPEENLVHGLEFKKGICLTILDEAYVSKIAVLRETNLQDSNPAQNRFRPKTFIRFRDPQCKDVNARIFMVP